MSESKIPRNNNGMPADRRPTEGMTGCSPVDKAPLTGSGYDRKWTKPSADVPKAGAVSKWSGNGSW